MKLALLALAWSLAWDASSAHAGPVALDIQGCPALTAGALSETLALELQDDRVVLVDGPAESRLEVRCLDGAALVAVVGDFGDRQKAEIIDLRDVSPDQRVRALGLTLAERYRAWAAAGPPGTATTATTASDDKARPPTRTSASVVLESETRLSAGLALTTWPTSLLLLGPRVDLTTRLGEIFSLHLALEAGFANTTTTPGDVSTWALGATVGLELGSTGARIAWALGPRLSVSALGFSGSGASADRSAQSGVAPLIAVGLGADLHLFVTDGWFVGLGVEAMMTALGVRATAPEGTLLEANDARLGASLGFGHRW